jgi:hypothetical protein
MPTRRGELPRGRKMDRPETFLHTQGMAQPAGRKRRLFTEGVRLKGLLQADLAGRGGFDGVVRRQVDPRPARLCMLVFARDPVQPARPQEPRARLFKMEGNPSRGALIPEGKHPGVIAHPCAAAGFPARDDLLYRGLKVRGKVNPFQQRFAHNALMADGEGQKQRQAVVRAVLIFHSAVDCTFS